MGPVINYVRKNRGREGEDESVGICVGSEGLFACVRACVCALVRPFTVKTSSVWTSWTTTEQIKDVVLKTFI